jgi:hypothetical protein
MSRQAVAVLSVMAVALGLAPTASGFEGGGRKPSEAPLIAFGQHYTGQLNNHKSDSNYNGYEEVAFWRLPPVSTHDTVTVNWHVLPFTHSNGFPVCMALVQGVDDFNWGAVYGQLNFCSQSGPAYSVSGSGTAQTTITVQNTDSSSSYFEFFSESEVTNPASFESFPYDFTVEPPRHFLGLALTPKSKVHANGAIGGAVTLADGSPAPDGLPFGLTVTWGGTGIATYAATTAGGRITFPLALPESALHQHAVFLVTHGADASYQAVTGRLAATVTPAVASAAEIACARATGHAHALSRQLRRLKRNASFARGASKRRLRRRARHVAHELDAARAAVQSTCP